MATNRKPARKVAPRKSTVRSASPRPSGRVAAWEGARRAIEDAEQAVEKEVRRISASPRAQQARKTLASLQSQIDSQGRKALRHIQDRLATLQVRARRERRVIARGVDKAVRKALIAIDIPSREEVQALTRRLDELARRIDQLHPTALRAPSRRRQTSSSRR